MTNNEITTRDDAASVMEQVVIQGDLAKLRPEQRAQYYARVCESLGVNPLTRPFEYIVLNGRLTLYARRDCADQLRRIHGINLNIVSRERMEDLYIVTARATDKGGRQDESTGVVNLAGLRGDALANALMKAETKAKRRVTLSLVGLGWLDETEVETIPGAQPVLPEAHWIDNDKMRKRFWGYVDELGLTDREVYEALGVEGMHEYQGTPTECKAALDAWIAEKAAGEQAPDDEAPEEDDAEDSTELGPGWVSDNDAVTAFWSRVRASWPRTRPDQVLDILGVKLLTAYQGSLADAGAALTKALGEPEKAA